jgi:hypothetical protein
VQQTPRTFFGFWLNRLIPSIKVVFFCFALSNLLGSSAMSGVPPLATSGSGSRSSDTDASGMGALFGLFRRRTLPIPHATRERRIEARHSRPCRRSCASIGRARPGLQHAGAKGVSAEGRSNIRILQLRWLLRDALPRCVPRSFGPALACVLLLSFVMTLTSWESVKDESRCAEINSTTHRS